MKLLVFLSLIGLGVSAPYHNGNYRNYPIGAYEYNPQAVHQFVQQQIRYLDELQQLVQQIEQQLQHRQPETQHYREERQIQQSQQVYHTLNQYSQQLHRKNGFFINRYAYGQRNNFPRYVNNPFYENYYSSGLYLYGSAANKRSAFPVENIQREIYELAQLSEQVFHQQQQVYKKLEQMKTVGHQLDEIQQTIQAMIGQDAQLIESIQQQLSYHFRIQQLYQQLQYESQPFPHVRSENSAFEPHAYGYYYSYLPSIA